MRGFDAFKTFFLIICLWLRDVSRGFNIASTRHGIPRLRSNAGTRLPSTKGPWNLGKPLVALFQLSYSTTFIKVENMLCSGGCEEGLTTCFFFSFWVSPSEKRQPNHVVQKRKFSATPLSFKRRDKQCRQNSCSVHSCISVVFHSVASVHIVRALFHCFQANQSCSIELLLCMSVSSIITLILCISVVFYYCTDFVQICRVLSLHQFCAYMPSSIKVHLFISIVSVYPAYVRICELDYTALGHIYCVGLHC